MRLPNGRTTFVEVNSIVTSRNYGNVIRTRVSTARRRRICVVNIRFYSFRIHKLLKDRFQKLSILNHVNVILNVIIYEYDKNNLTSENTEIETIKSTKTPPGDGKSEGGHG